MFIQHLVQFIATSINSGSKVILTVDANEHIAKGKLTNELLKLGLVEGYCNKFQTKGLASHFRGLH